jgi:hypothetical protein
MKEELVTFETAKKAQQQGCELQIFTGYWEYEDLHGDTFVSTCFPGDNSKERINIREEVKLTQNLLRKWLREKHRIHIEIPHYSDAPNGSEYESDLGSYGATVNEPKTSHKCDIFVSSINHETYEQALEEALLEALKYVP